METSGRRSGLSGSDFIGSRGSYGASSVFVLPTRGERECHREEHAGKRGLMEKMLFEMLGRWRWRGVEDGGEESTRRT